MKIPPQRNQTKQRYLQQELVFGDALDRFQEVGTEWKFVSKIALALAEERVVLFAHLTAQLFRLRNILAVEAVQRV